MEILSTIGTYIIPFLVILTVLVFVHELGHYWVARRCGVKIEAFAVGFGPEIFGFTDRGNTRWKFCAIPLGGYVKMFGDADVASRPGDGMIEDDLEEGEETGDWAEGRARHLTPEERAVSFHHKTLPQRAAIVVAGPMANFLAAIALFIGLFVFFGQMTTPPIVGQVVEGSAAEQAGFRAGDRIVNINGQRIDRFEDIQMIVQINLDSPLSVVLERNGEEMGLTATPTRVVTTDVFGNEHETARLGLSASGTEIVKLGPVDAVIEAVEETYKLTVGSLKTVWQIISGQRSAEQLAGPVGIAEMSGQVAGFGLGAIINFMALLSVSLGLINLFPIPMLDGGHLLFYAIEAVRGRPLGEKAQEYGFRIGLALVLSLVLFVTFNDLTRLGLFDFVTGFIAAL